MSDEEIIDICDRHPDMFIVEQNVVDFTSQTKEEMRRLL